MDFHEQLSLSKFAPFFCVDTRTFNNRCFDTFPATESSYKMSWSYLSSRATASLARTSASSTRQLMDTIVIKVTNNANSIWGLSCGMEIKLAVTIRARFCSLNALSIAHSGLIDVRNAFSQGWSLLRFALELWKTCSRPIRMHFLWSTVVWATRFGRKTGVHPFPGTPYLQWQFSAFVPWWIYIGPFGSFMAFNKYMLWPFSLFLMWKTVP